VIGFGSTILRVAFVAVAEQIDATLAKIGLSSMKATVPTEHPTAYARRDQKKPRTHVRLAPRKSVYKRSGLQPFAAHVITPATCRASFAGISRRRCARSRERQLVRFDAARALSCGPVGPVTRAMLWRLRYKLSLRDLAEMFLVRGVVFTYEAVRRSCTCQHVSAATRRFHHVRRTAVQSAQGATASTKPSRERRRSAPRRYFRTSCHNRSLSAYGEGKRRSPTTSREPR